MHTPSQRHAGRRGCRGPHGKEVKIFLASWAHPGQGAHRAHSFPNIYDSLKRKNRRAANSPAF